MPDATSNLLPTTPASLRALRSLASFARNRFLRERSHQIDAKLAEDRKARKEPYRAIARPGATIRLELALTPSLEQAMRSTISKKQEPSKALRGMDRFEIAAALQEIGLLLRLSGKDQYRSQAYSRAAQAVSGVDGDFAILVRQNRLTEIKGIGESLAAVIKELHATGRSSLLDTLRSELPKGVLELSRIPGLTVTRIQALNEALGIASVSDLKAALAAGKLRNVSGFGAKTEETLREQISRYETHDDRILLVAALKVGQKVIDYMRGLVVRHRTHERGTSRIEAHPFPNDFRKSVDSATRRSIY
jgi:predicted flap endonuclease-1-like 5' DNA nuclease